MMDLEALRVFVKVAELGSFTHAGLHLDISKSRASQLVQSLEGELGVTLFQRSTRLVRPTGDGEQLVARAKRLIAEADELEALFQGPRNLKGRVRIGIPTGCARSLIIPHMPELLALHPGLELEIDTSDRMSDLHREGLDCVLRVGALTDSSLVAHRIGVLPLVNCVSVPYIQKYGIPQTLADLERHFIVHYTTTLGSGSPCFEYVDADGVHELPMRSLLAVNGADAYRSACLAGLGIIQAPRYGLSEAIADGSFIEVLPDYTGEAMPTSIVHAHGRQVPKRVRAVITWLASLMEPYVRGGRACP